MGFCTLMGEMAKIFSVYHNLSLNLRLCVLLEIKYPVCLFSLFASSFELCVFFFFYSQASKDRKEYFTKCFSV